MNDNPSPAMAHAKPRAKRRATVCIAVVLVVVIGLAAAWVYRHNAAAEAASQQAAAQSDEREYLLGRMWWDVPDVVSLLGLGSLDAIEAIGHGAAVRDDSVGYDAEVPDDVKRVTIALAEERSQDNSEAPTVVLWVKNGRVIQAVYSSSMRSFGFSNTLTFAEAIEKAHVVELGLREAGVSLDRESVELPKDEAEYARYQDDGRTLEREHVAYEGEADRGDLHYGWLAELDYDYADAIDEGNLVYTHRVLSVGARIL